MSHTVVLTAVPDLRSARRLARRLVSDKLAACVSVTAPAMSVYRWKGRLTTGSERLLIIKTRADRFARLKAAIAADHPYEVPEILEWKVSRGSRAYLRWLDDSLR